MFNGTATVGLGTKAATDLGAVGFAISGAAANADQPVGATTVIRYDSTLTGRPRPWRRRCPGATLAAGAGLGHAIQVVVGSSYAGATRVTVKGAATSGPATPKSAADDLCG